MNTYGERVKVTIFGESHGPAIGVVLDGVPAGESASIWTPCAFRCAGAPPARPT